MKISVEISVGELFDKITILKIKTEKIQDNEKLKNIYLELDILNKEASKILNPSIEIIENIEKLKNVNTELWDIENLKREMEAKKNFGEDFINISREVHFKNDYRATIKKKINELTNSIVTEEKEYFKY
ncbi:DUF6165 family protein [Alphaproteobacteria bacterium]|nr:DUF6165 family protein [Alphaproteobacteria bacterium]